MPSHSSQDVTPEQAAERTMEAFNAACMEFQLQKPELEALLADDFPALAALNETSWRMREAHLRAIKDGLTANNDEIQAARESIARAVAELRECSADTEAFRHALTGVGRAAAALVKIAATVA